MKALGLCRELPLDITVMAGSVCCYGCCHPTFIWVLRLDKTVALAPVQLVSSTEVSEATEISIITKMAKSLFKLKKKKKGTAVSYYLNFAFY